jgi:uncharacterized membrane protein YeaQ/YmgE (transglycosylase-associated protein family)
MNSIEVKTGGALVEQRKSKATAGARQVNPSPRGLLMLHLIWKFVLGLVIGYLARILLPGGDHIGFWLTGIVGVVGSFGGHWIAQAAGLESGEKPSGRFFSALISLAGAIILLILLRFVHH